MNSLAIRSDATPKNMSLDALWEEARIYGLVSVSNMDDGECHAYIKFRSKDHTEMRVRSRFNHKTPQDALYTALENAKQTVADIESMTKRLT